MSLGQKQSEGAALADGAGQTDFAAKETGDFTADRQAKTGPAVFAAGAAIGLMEGLEDDLLLIRRNADAGIRYGEGDHVPGVIQDLVFGIPAAGDGGNIQSHLALFGELE